MNIAVTGSIATDNLMTFAGRLTEQIVPEALHRVSLSLMVEDLVVRRGGTAANIAFGLAQLGVRPILVGAAGHDFDEYRAWLERNGVDTASVHISDVHYTSRFFCTTDADHNQIASFYAGAMMEASSIELAPVAKRVGGIDLLIVSPNNPAAMARHTDEARRSGIPFLADPSQQLSSLDGDEVVHLVSGARYLVANDYEMALIETKTGWSHEDVLGQVDVCVTTHGPQGSVIEKRGEPAIRVAVAPEEERADPTGVGDAYRAGFVAGQAWGLDLERSGQLGSLLATLVLERIGTQEYEVERDSFLSRMAAAFGDDAAADIEPFLK